MDVGISAVGGASSEAQDALRVLREQQRIDERRERLAVFERELAVLGIDLEAAAGMNEKKLRRIYRMRARELHPDVNGVDAPQAGASSEEAVSGLVVPSIYEINEAYESVKKIL